MQQQKQHTSTGFSFSHSERSSPVRLSTTLSSEITFICRLATWVCMDESLRRMMSEKALHSPSTLSLYSHDDGNWNLCLSSRRCPSLYISTCFSHDFIFRFRDCTYVIRPTASDVFDVSIDCCSRSERDCNIHIQSC